LRPPNSITDGLTGNGYADDEVGAGMDEIAKRGLEWRGLPRHPLAARQKNG
jgi:hypothetical protein